jgi:hypothetical protein
MSVGDELYSDVASVGRTWALISAIIITIISLAAIIAGIVLLTKKGSRTKVSATIVKINNGDTGSVCPKISDNNYSCLIWIKYNEVKEPVMYNYTGNTQYYVGQTISVWIDKNNPQNFDLDYTEPKKLGTILIVGGIIILGFSWLYVWLTRKSKFIAAASGANLGLNIITGGRL